MRSTQTLNIRRWASHRNALLRTPESDNIQRLQGLPASFGQDEFVDIGMFNQWISEITAIFKDIEKHGILPWVGYIRNDDVFMFNSSRGIDYQTGQLVIGSDRLIYQCISGENSLEHDPVTDTDNSHWQLLSELLDDYEVNGICLGSNGRIYRCKVSTMSSTTDPVTDSSESVWEELIQTIPIASELQSGIIRIATTDETISGTSSNLAINLEDLTATITDRISRLVSDGFVIRAELSNTTLRLIRSGTLSSVNVDLAPLLSSFAPLRSPTLTGDVTVPTLSNTDRSTLLATTAFTRTVANNRFSSGTSTNTQPGITRAANTSELNARTATDVFVDLAGLESRLTAIIGQKGIRGEPGRSLPGLKGRKGRKGRKGIPGPDGNSVRGPIGERGNPGPSIAGQKGDLGPPGLQIPGPKGPIGDDGDSIPGPVGIQGISGVSIRGQKGRRGDQGSIGQKGRKGIKGVKGLVGRTGERGRSYRTSFNQQNIVLAYPTDPISWVSTGLTIQTDDYIIIYKNDRSFGATRGIAVTLRYADIPSTTAGGDLYSGRLGIRTTAPSNSQSGRLEMRLRRNSSSILEYQMVWTRRTEANFESHLWIFHPTVTQI